MGKRNSYPHGQFCWVDLCTSDPKAAKEFYSGLFGWTFEDLPTPRGPYSMAYLKDQGRVAALYESKEYPPAWQNFISVESADEIAPGIEKNGGKLLMPPMDVMEAGRMAWFQDPTGAYTGLWEAKEHIGAQWVNDPGTLCWNELFTRDLDKAMQFYTTLFGWNCETTPGTPKYVSVKNHGRSSAGMMGPHGGIPAEVPAHWNPYFAVEDTDATLQAAEASGGKVVYPATEIKDVGRFSVLADPQGATFSVIKMIRADD